MHAIFVTARREAIVRVGMFDSSSLSASVCWLTLGKTIAFVCSLALPLLLVRRLSQAELGLYKQVFLIVSTAVVVLPLGFSMSAFYFFAREHERQSQVVLNILLFNAVVGGLACSALVSHPSLLALVFGDPAMVDYAPLIGVVVLLWITASGLDIVAIAHREMRLATIFIVASQLMRTILMLAAAVQVGSVRALIYAAIAHGGLQTVAFLLYLRSRWGDFWRSFDMPMLGAQLAYALPLGAAGLLYSLQGDLHSYFVSSRFSAAEYAIYSIGCFQVPLFTILGESVGSVMIPRVSVLQRDGDPREIIRLTAQAMRRLAAVYFPLYAFLLVTGPEFIAFLFTPRYLASAPIFAINLTLLPLNVLPLDPILRAYADQRYFLLRLRLVLFAASLAGLWLSVGRLGLVGAIAVVVVGTLLERTVIALRLGRVLGVTRGDSVLLKDVGRLALAALAGGVVASVVRSSMPEAGAFTLLVVCGLCFLLVYLLALQLTAGGPILRTSRAASAGEGDATAGGRVDCGRGSELWERVGGRGGGP